MYLLKFKALADQTRLRLVSILYHYELSVNELVRIMEMGQSRISRHLKILTEAGLLKARRDGLWVFYTAPKTDFLTAILPFLADLPSAATDLERAARTLEERAAQARQFFNSIAEKWDDLNREILGDFHLPARVVKAIQPGCKVAVDLGCGTGAALNHIREAAELAIGVDGSSAMLDLCRDRLCPLSSADSTISLRIGELGHLPLADHEANFACLNLVLHHLPEPQSVFPEIHRILAPNGILFIADFLAHNDETMRVRYGDHWLGFEQNILETWLDANGFRLLKSEVQPVGRKLNLILITAKAEAIN